MGCRGVVSGVEGVENLRGVMGVVVRGVEGDVWAWDEEDYNRTNSKSKR